MEEIKKQVISKWNKPAQDGKMLRQVVTKYLMGKNKKGKAIWRSVTKHEPI